MAEEAAAKEYMTQLVENPDKVKYVYSIALPSEVLMFKMMRASVGVKKVSELWFFMGHASYNAI